jgi:hypothetical protein
LAAGESSLFRSHDPMGLARMEATIREGQAPALVVQLASSEEITAEAGAMMFMTGESPYLSDALGERRPGIEARRGHRVRWIFLHPDQS